MLLPASTQADRSTHEAGPEPDADEDPDVVAAEEPPELAEEPAGVDEPVETGAEPESVTDTEAVEAALSVPEAVTEAAAFKQLMSAGSIKSCQNRAGHRWRGDIQLALISNGPD